MKRMRIRGLAGILLAVLLLPACGQPDAGAATDGLVVVDLDRRDPERLLRYYFGGYAGPGGGDPFEAGMLREQEGRFYLDAARLAQQHPGLAGALDAPTADGRLDWDELEAFLRATYYDARGLPPTLDALRAEVPYAAEDTAWFSVEIDGVMTTARRRVFVPVSALRHALRGYAAQGERLIYPEGTPFIGEHWDGGARIETTMMRKRADGAWDYATYGPDGRLADATQARPRALKTPTQCVGCHYGSKLFEPERSFPAAAPDGPHGSRGLYVPEAWRDAEVVRFFDEHRKRSDTVLGLYNTLFVSRLRADRRAGRLAPADSALLDALGL